MLIICPFNSLAINFLHVMYMGKCSGKGKFILRLVCSGNQDIEINDTNQNNVIEIAFKSEVNLHNAFEIITFAYRDCHSICYLSDLN